MPNSDRNDPSVQRSTELSKAIVKLCNSHIDCEDDEVMGALARALILFCMAAGHSKDKATSAFINNWDNIAKQIARIDIISALKGGKPQ